MNDDILIGDKGNFESVLSYKEAHKTDFLALQQEVEFLAAITNIAPQESPHFSRTLKSQNFGFLRWHDFESAAGGELCERQKNKLISFMNS